MRNGLLFFLSVFLALPVFAQQQWQDTLLNKEELNLIINRKLGKLVTGNTTGSFISNYASFDPVAGSFSFKGSFPVNQDSTKARISFLSFKINGDLISDSYSALFQNSKLNTGVTLEGQYHFRRERSFQVEKHLSTDELQFNLQKALLDSVYDQQIEDAYSLEEQIHTNSRDLQQLNLLAGYELQRKRQLIDSLAHALSTQTPSLANWETLKRNADSLVKLRVELNKGMDDSISRKRKMDSLHILLLRPRDAIALNTNVITVKYNKMLDSLRSAIALTATKFDWWTLTAAVSRKKYYTYSKTLPFSEQIQPGELTTLRLGVAWNFYKESSFPKKVFYMNVGVQRYKDNNTAQLSTTEIVDARAEKNAAGDTTRTVTRKYNAYTDSIMVSSLWDAYMNFYFLSPGRNSGFHLFPSVDLYDDEGAVANLGVGYLISFVNSKKDSPVINVEAYVQFTDLFNKLEGKPKFWNRNEIGIRLTLPLSFF